MLLLFKGVLMSEYLEIDMDGKKAHVSVGAIIINSKGDILMMDRKNKPLGWACPAGHIDTSDKSPEEALIREVKEETGIDITNNIKFKLIDEFLPWNVCSSGMKGHYWYLYLVYVKEDRFKPNDEAKEMRWIPRVKLKDLKLEEAFEYWFKKLKWI